MRVLIVDDEAPARHKLRRMLGVFDDIEIVGEAPDGAIALQLTEQLQPDVIFLDAQMPERDGFDVAESLPERGPAIVFVTAFDQYALRAFDAHARDYLLKPVEPERLERTVHRLRHIVGLSRRAPTRLTIADQKQVQIVECADIDWIESADNYVLLHLGERSVLMRRTLAALLEELGEDFVRVHRSAAVALRRVALLRPRGKGDATIVLHSGAEVPCSRQHRDALIERLRSGA